MAPKVVHLSEIVHAKAKEYCLLHGLGLKEWVSNLICRELGVSTDTPEQVGKTVHKERSRVPNASTKPASPPEPVAKKKVLPTPQTGEVNGSKPWEQPPFWQRNASGGPKEGAPQEGSKLEEDREGSAT